MDEEIYNVTIDHPIGSSDEFNPSFVYSVNYGYVDNSSVDSQVTYRAYVIGVDSPLEKFSGKKIAVVHRQPDNEEIWVIAPDSMPFNIQQIEEMIDFQECNYDSYVEMLNEEMWDAYDRNGNRIGYQVPRSKAKSLPSGVYRMAVMVYVKRSDGKILTTQRSRNKTYPLKWEVSGGSVLTGESPEEGALRELSEETGIQADIANIKEIYSYVDDKRQCIYHIYSIEISNDVKIHLQMGETMDYEFLDYKEFKELVVSDRFIPSEQKRFLMHEKLMDERLK